LVAGGLVAGATGLADRLMAGGLVADVTGFWGRLVATRGLGRGAGFTAPGFEGAGSAVCSAGAGTGVSDCAAWATESDASRDGVAFRLLDEASRMTTAIATPEAIPEMLTVIQLSGMRGRGASVPGSGLGKLVELARGGGSGETIEVASCLTEAVKLRGRGKTGCGRTALDLATGIGMLKKLGVPGAGIGGGSARTIMSGSTSNPSLS